MAGGRCRILVIEDDHESAEQIVESLVASVLRCEDVQPEPISTVCGFPLVQSGRAGYGIFLPTIAPRHGASRLRSLNAGGNR
jgi:hypothetical protein